MNFIGALEFRGGMERLSKMFGKEVMNPDRMEIIGKYTKGLTIQQWVYVVDELIGSCRTAPTLRDFRKHAQHYLDENAQIREQEEMAELARRRAAGTTCVRCNDIGSISAFRIGVRTGSYSFRCPEPGCLKSSKLSKQIPLWDDIEYGNSFSVVGSNEGLHEHWFRNHQNLFGTPAPQGVKGPLSDDLKVLLDKFRNILKQMQDLQKYGR